MPTLAEKVRQVKKGTTVTGNTWSNTKAAQDHEQRMTTLNTAIKSLIAKKDK